MARVYFSTKTATNLKRRVRGYELKYRMKSAEMISRLDSGEIEETETIAKWVQALTVLRRKNGKTLTSGIA